MTVIGALKTMDGVVLCADRQETYGDYGKWDVEKIKHFELSQTYRVFMAGSGDADIIDMIWEKMMGALTVEVKANDLKPLIIECVRQITKKCIFPCPYGEKPHVNLIWVIQRIEESLIATWNRIEVFRTRGLAVNSISGPYFTGSPVLITRYLTDMHLRGFAWSTEEAQALACYVLWEAKEYDTYCGKNSDVIVIRNDGGVRRLLYKQIKYWEEHFAYLKSAFRIWPLLTCATPFAENMYPQGDYLARFKAAVKTLTASQKKMRTQTAHEASKLEKELLKNIQKAAKKYYAKLPMPKNDKAK